MTTKTQAELEAEAKAKSEAEAKAKADAEAKEEDAEDADPEKESDDSQKKAPNTTIDYEAELVKERKAREAAEKAAADNAFKLREKKRKEAAGEDDEEEVNEDDKPLTRREFLALQEQERQATDKKLQAARIEKIADEYATTESEKNLIIEIHKNRIFPSNLTLEEQIEESYAIANRKKLVGERNEALRALKGKGTNNDNPAGTFHDSPKGTEPQISPKSKKVYAQLGYVYNSTAKRYEKKTAEGKLMFIDPKTKKVVIAK